MTNEKQTKPDYKKRALSLIQPSGVPTLGNYVGALRNWVAIQNSNKYECFFGVADLHAITVRQKRSELRTQIYEMVALLIAIGLDPDKSLIFVQSQIPEHTQLGWLLACHSQFGELSRMTQFKEKSESHSDNINLGLFAYPSLMAADILLYQPDIIPVGDDQKQHVELTRDVAGRFNSANGNTFKIPEPYIMKTGARIRSLQDPTIKMSKSDDNLNSFVSLKDDDKTIERKIKRAVTDSEAKVYYDIDKKPGVSNLMDIYTSVTNKNHEEITKEFEGKGYGDFKSAVAKSVVNELSPIRNKFEELMQNKEYLEIIMKKGAVNASIHAAKTLDKAMNKMGFITLKP